MLTLIDAHSQVFLRLVLISSFSPSPSYTVLLIMVDLNFQKCVRI